MKFIMKFMIKNFFALGLFFPVLLAANHAVAANAEKGKTLHDENCVSCHLSLRRKNSDLGGNSDSAYRDADWLYVREEKQVTAFSGLRARVDRCQFSQGLQWFDVDIDDVTEFLDRDFYHFKSK